MNTMAQIIAYLTFNGNCREAMFFYQQCFGGELSVQTVGESPDADNLPKRMKQYVLQATLMSNGITLMATDMVGDGGFSRGNAIAMMLHCDSEVVMRKYYEKLSAQGQSTQPIAPTFDGALFGGSLTAMAIVGC